MQIVEVNDEETKEKEKVVSNGKAGQPSRLQQANSAAPVATKVSVPANAGKPQPDPVSSSEDEDEEDEDTAAESSSKDSVSLSAILHMNIFCTVCRKQINQNQKRDYAVVKDLQVLICRRCERDRDGEWTKDESGFDEFCTWCGDGGNLLLCDNESCKRSFCKTCIQRNFKRAVVSKIIEAETWECFVCNPSRLRKLQAICQAVIENARLADLEDGAKVRRKSISPAVANASQSTASTSGSSKRQAQSYETTALSKADESSPKAYRVDIDSLLSQLIAASTSLTDKLSELRTAAAEYAPDADGDMTRVLRRGGDTILTQDSGVLTEYDDIVEMTKEILQNTEAMTSKSIKRLNVPCLKLDMRNSSRRKRGISLHTDNPPRAIKGVMNGDVKQPKVQSTADQSKNASSTSVKDSDWKREPVDSAFNETSDSEGPPDEPPRKRRKTRTETAKKRPTPSSQRSSKPRPATNTPAASSNGKAKQKDAAQESGQKSSADNPDPLEKSEGSADFIRVNTPTSGRDSGPESDVDLFADNVEEPDANLDDHASSISSSRACSAAADPIAEDLGPKAQSRTSTSRSSRRTSISPVSSTSVEVEKPSSSVMTDGKKQAPKPGTRKDKAKNSSRPSSGQQNAALVDQTGADAGAEADAEKPAPSTVSNTIEGGDPGSSDSSSDSDSLDGESDSSKNAMSQAHRKPLKIKRSKKEGKKKAEKENLDGHSSDDSDADADLRRLANIERQLNRQNRKQDRSSSDGAENSDKDGGGKPALKKASKKKKRDSDSDGGSIDLSKPKSGVRKNASNSKHSDADSQDLFSDSKDSSADENDADKKSKSKPTSSSKASKDGATSTGKSSSSKTVSNLLEKNTDEDLELDATSDRDSDDEEREEKKESTPDKSKKTESKNGEQEQNSDAPASEDGEAEVPPAKAKNSKKAKKLLKEAEEFLSANDDDSEDDTVGKKKRPKRKKDGSENDDEDPKKKGKDKAPGKKRRRVVASSSSEQDEEEEHSDDEEDSESGDTEKLISSDSEDAELEEMRSKSKKKKKKSKKKKKQESKGKGKRKRVVQESSEDEANEDGEDSPNKRKDIRKILKDKQLTQETKAAHVEERERLKRLAERQKEYNFIDIEDDSKSPLKQPKVKKLVLEFNPDTKEPIVEVHTDLVKLLKPHQADGIKFLYDSVIESAEKADQPGGGCILAHCMGLGKTLQVIAFLHTVLTHETFDFTTVLVVCPLNTVLNWFHEFEKWLERNGLGLEVYELVNVKAVNDRIADIEAWHKKGGIMIMGYEMYRMLSAGGGRTVKKAAMRKRFEKALLDPGPDIIVCDEGHLLKNQSTAINKQMTQIRTRRRICLTGTPLQNNLVEYHTMVDFIKPKLLGTKKEFMNRFGNPIKNGQHNDSSEYDVRLMKRRSHILHDTLKGIVHRRDYSVLSDVLMPKHEYVLKIRLSKQQVDLYNYYLENVVQGVDQENIRRRKALFADYQCLQRVWTHCYSLELAEEEAFKRRGYQDEEEEEFIDDEDDTSEDDSKKRKRIKDKDGEIADDMVVVIDDDEQPSTSKAKPKGSESDEQNSSDQEEEKDSGDEEVIKQYKTRSRGALAGEGEGANSRSRSKSLSPAFTHCWFNNLIEPKDRYDYTTSGKLQMLFSILKKCETIGDKLLIFSQSLTSLNLIEHFLQVFQDTKWESPADSLGEIVGEHWGWERGKDYFRMDGSTSAQKRKEMADQFNDPKNLRCRLFLISTRAGSLGINLVGANRVIIFDASWNPSHDVQSIFRVYRFGQTRPCYIYRFVAEGTMEETIYDRQVSKQSMAKRVVDEHQIERHFTMSDLLELYRFNPYIPENDPSRTIPPLPKDLLLADVIKEQEDADKFVVKYHEHDSLLQNKEDEALDEEERKAAWEEFENERSGRAAALKYAEQLAQMQAQQAQMNAMLANQQAHAAELQDIKMYLQMGRTFLQQSNLPPGEMDNVYNTLVQQYGNNIQVLRQKVTDIVIGIRDRMMNQGQQAR